MDQWDAEHLADILTVAGLDADAHYDEEAGWWCVTFTPPGRSAITITGAEV